MCLIKYKALADIYDICGPYSCVTDECTAYMVVCEPNYPHILAFSFLDELMKEFSLLYTPSVVKSVRRPYAFIEFGKISSAILFDRHDFIVIYSHM